MLRAVTAVVSVALGVLVGAGGSNASLGLTSSWSASIEIVTYRGVVGFGYEQSPDEPAPARIAVHVPDEFALTPSANGAPVGSVVGSDSFDMAANARNPLTGVLTIADPATFAAEGKACTGLSAHDAVWAASAGAPGATAMSIPIFVDGRTFTICPSAGLQGGTPLGIGLQLGVVNGAIDRPLLAAPTSPGRFVWSATVSWSGQADATLLNIFKLPQRATFRANVVHNRVQINGRVVADEQGIANVRLRAFITGAGRSLIIHGHSRADGRFTLSHRLGGGRFSVRVNSDPEQRDVTATECAGGSCAYATETILGLQAAPGTIHLRSPGSR